MSVIVILLAALMVPSSATAASTDYAACEYKSESGVPMPVRVIPFAGPVQTPLYVETGQFGGGKILVEAWVPSPSLAVGTLHQVWVCTLVDCLEAAELQECAVEKARMILQTAAAVVCDAIDDEVPCPFDAEEESQSNDSEPGTEGAPDSGNETPGNGTDGP